MHSPANFDSLALDGLLVDWLGALKQYSVEALIVLGPAVTGTPKSAGCMRCTPLNCTFGQRAGR